MSVIFISLSFFSGAVMLVAVSDLLVNRFHCWLDEVRVSAQDQGVSESLAEEYVGAVCDGDVIRQKEFERMSL